MEREHSRRRERVYPGTDVTADNLITQIKKGLSHQALWFKTYAFAARPFYRYVEFAGIHTNPSFASEGTASPNSTSVLMTGRLRQMGFRAAGAAALIPSSAPGRIRFIQPLIQSK